MFLNRSEAERIFKYLRYSKAPFFIFAPSHLVLSASWQALTSRFRLQHSGRGRASSAAGRSRGGGGFRRGYGGNRGGRHGFYEGGAEGATSSMTATAAGSATKGVDNTYPCSSRIEFFYLIIISYVGILHMSYDEGGSRRWRSRQGFVAC